MPASIWSLLSRSSGAVLPAAPVCQATTLLKGRPQDHRVEFVFLAQQRVRGFSGRSETSVHGIAVALAPAQNPAALFRAQGRCERALALSSQRLAPNIKSDTRP